MADNKFPQRFVGSYPLPFCRCQNKPVLMYPDHYECPLCGKVEIRKTPKRVLYHGQWINWEKYVELQPPSQVGGEGENNWRGK